MRKRCFRGLRSRPFDEAVASCAPPAHSSAGWGLRGWQRVVPR